MEKWQASSPLEPAGEVEPSGHGVHWDKQIFSSLARNKKRRAFLGFLHFHARASSSLEYAPENRTGPITIAIPHCCFRWNRCFSDTGCRC
jgi:hypothetical protein